MSLKWLDVDFRRRIVRILKTKEQSEKEKNEKLPPAEVLAGKGLQLRAGVAQLVEHRPSKPKKANSKNKSRRGKAGSDKSPK